MQWNTIYTMLSKVWVFSQFLTTARAFQVIVPRPALAPVLSSTAGQGGGVFYDGPQYDQSNLRESEQPSKSDSSWNESCAIPKRGVQRKDVVIIGGGLAGLSTALYLSQLDPDRHITILEKEGVKQERTTVASFAAAGMLAPQSERLPKGPLLDLCMASRHLYPDFVDLVETMAQDEDGREHLWSSTDEKPWSVGYVASGGFLAPAFAGDSVATWSPPEESASATWLDAMQIRELEPNLHPDVVGGWWFPEDASVDARRLTCSLRAACVAAGVQLQMGAQVTSLDLFDGRCKGLWLESGKYLITKSVLVANGAWMRNLLPVPIEPHKGQSISLRMPADEPPMLRRVLFAQDTYIVPKADGRIIVGATVEAGSYDPNVTPAGLMHIMAHALQLVPGLADLPLEETWVGLRPTTPDKGPILGKTPWDNLFLAGGYWRNGVLLAPKTGQLLASLMSGRPLPSSDQALLDAFAWDRYTSPEGSAALAANSRYAASMHPIHRRKSGSGVAAAVGTELGSYSTARSSSEERSKDRKSLFEYGKDDSLERAAELGRQDASAFVYGNDEPDVAKKDESTLTAWTELLSLPEKESNTKLSLVSQDTLPENTPTALKYEGSADAYAVSSRTDKDVATDLPSLYKTIQQNKQQRGDLVMREAEPDDRQDPGFRIYHVDHETGKTREVPPYTSPEAMARSVAKEAHEEPPMDENVIGSVPEENGDSILDGYKAIEEANAGRTEQDLKQAMRQARIINRGVSVPLKLDEADFPPVGPMCTSQSSTKTVDESAGIERLNVDGSFSSDLLDIYESIRQNKAAQSNTVEMGNGPVDDRPDPGFRIYYVDPDTGESHEVPPYTSPEEMVKMVAQEKEEPNKNHMPEKTNDSTTVDATTRQVEYSEKTFDGYQDIQQANARTTREEELQAMRVARQQNRLGSDGI